MRTVAFVRSNFHLKLLHDNDMKDIEIITNNRLKEDKYYKFYLNKIEYFPKESKDLNFIRNIKENRKYYFRLKEKFDLKTIEKFILFTDNDPISKFFFYNLKHKNIELWEDGLNHYICFFPNFYLKSVVKLFLGHYYKGIFKKKLDRRKIKVRDRFQEKNLCFNLSRSEKSKKITGYLFIGQPLVEDNILSKKKYTRKLKELSKMLDGQIYYLKHPREGKWIKDLKSIKVIETLDLAEDFIIKRNFDGYLSAFSTTNLNIVNLSKNNFYLAEYFELPQVSKKMKKVLGDTKIEVLGLDKIEEKLKGGGRAGYIMHTI